MTLKFAATLALVLGIITALEMLLAKRGPQTPGQPRAFLRGLGWGAMGLCALVAGGVYASTGDAALTLDVGLVLAAVCLAGWLGALHQVYRWGSSRKGPDGKA